ncbi:MAG: pectate lyase [Bacteroidia bacterium]|nr:pectate lyase [Bacteroidia bacterium]
MKIMKIQMWMLGLMMAASCGAQTTTQQELTKPSAFPGAEGFGKYTTGGRGGEVYIVTNLNDEGPGSLRYGIRKKGPRTIVFAISGTIQLKSQLDINNGDLTIAGQTAPGEGICIRDFSVKLSANNVIIRYMRFRLGDETKQQGDAFYGTRNKDIVIDHCTMSWSVDECASFYYNENFTMQWCLISESLSESVHEKGSHGYGGIWGGMRATFHHNLLASHTSRLPRFSGSSTTPNKEDELVDFRNNVIYNWGHNNTYGGEKGRYNMVNNYYKPGPATNEKRRTRIANPSAPVGQFYVTGNVLEGNSEVTSNNWRGVDVDGADADAKAAEPFACEPLPVESAEQAYEEVITKAGASLKRDAIDARIADEARTGRSAMGKNHDGIIDSQKEVGGWPELKSLPAPQDADSDGMPDAWEKEHKLNPNDAGDSATFTLSKSYSNLEVYINSLVKS